MCKHLKQSLMCVWVCACLLRASQVQHIGGVCCAAGIPHCHTHASVTRLWYWIHLRDVTISCTSCWWQGLLWWITPCLLLALFCWSCLYYASEHNAEFVILIHGMVGEVFVTLGSFCYVFCTIMWIVRLWKKWLPSRLSSSLPILRHKWKTVAVISVFCFCM